MPGGAAAQAGYEIGGIAIRVQADSGQLVSTIDQLLAAYRCPNAVSDCQIEVTLRSAALPGGERRYPPAPEVFRYDVARGYDDGTDLLITDGFSELRVRRGCAIEGLIDPSTLEQSYLFAVITFNLALQVCLRQAGLFYTHAAAVHGPGGSILITGDSQAGKTTLTLALVEQGWRFISDDAVFLRGVSQNTEIIAFRRPVHLSAATTEMFSALASLARGPMPGRLRRVWDLDPNEAFPGRVDDRTGQPAMLVIVQAAGDQATSRLCPLAKPLALQGLLRQSAFVVLGGGSTQRHLDVLARTVRCSASYHLTRGRDALGRPAVVADLIRRAQQS